MHIELTDHLRCPQEHAEAFLVLVPETMAGRQVVAGHLGCPACGWSTAWAESIPDFGGGWRSTAVPPCDAAAIVALLGIVGPGGWLALAGSAGILAPDLGELLPGVNIVAVNPPANVAPSETISIVLSERWPIKRHAMRGVFLGGDVGGWRDDAMQSVLPGLRAAGVGEAPPASPGIEILGSADGLWLSRRR